jgi:hypothetical protein
MPIALTTPQVNQVKTIAVQVPHHLRAQFLSRLASCCRRTMAMAMCGAVRTRPCRRD